MSSVHERATVLKSSMHSVPTRVASGSKYSVCLLTEFGIVVVVLIFNELSLLQSASFHI